MECEGIGIHCQEQKYEIHFAWHSSDGPHLLRVPVVYLVPRVPLAKGEHIQPPARMVKHLLAGYIPVGVTNNNHEVTCYTCITLSGGLRWFS